MKLTWLMDRLHRFRYFFRRDEFEVRIREEMRLHLDLKMNEDIQSGVPIEEARRRAQVRFGNIAKIQEESREVYMIRQLEIVIQDLRYAFRTIRRAPGFAAVVVLSMALGIGANSAIFNLVNTLMLKSLPVKDPQQLVILANDKSWLGAFSSPLLQTIVRRQFSYPAYIELRDNNHVLSGVIAVRGGQQLSATIGGQSEVVRGTFASGNFYAVFGVGTIIGRPFSPDDDRAPGTSPVAVISYSYWQRRFGRDPGVLGKTIALNGKACTIIGVTNPGFYGLDAASNPPDVTLPITMQDSITGEARLMSRSQAWLQVIGRLRPDVPEKQALAELDVIYQNTEREAKEESEKKNGPSPDSKNDFSHMQFQPGARGMSYLGAMYSNSLMVLMAAVALVLLIACANVASLLLARATSRQKEMAVRSAIGAGRLRLVRQLLTESVLLAIIGGAFGILFCLWGSRILLNFIFTGDPVPAALQPGSGVLWYTLVLSVATGLLFGIAPAFRSTASGLASSLKESATNLSGSASRSLLARMLVVGQVALSLVLLVAAGLLVRSFQKLKSVDLGFKPDGVIVGQTDANLLGYKGERLQNLYKDLIEKARTIPAATSVSMSDPSPIGNGESVGAFTIPGRPEDPNHELETHITLISPNYFGTLGIRLMQGRDFSLHDDSSSPQMAIVNQKFAHEIFGNDDPIGQRIQFGSKSESDICEVVGVAADAKYTEVREAPTPMVYRPLFQNKGDDPYAMLEVRTAADLDGTIPFVKDAIRQVDADLSFQMIRSLRLQVDDSLSEQRLIATLCSFFGVFALVLACVGLYGVVSYSVSRRTSEIGVRIALGASRRNVMWLVVRDTLITVGAGAVMGLAVSLIFSKVLGAVLFNLGPRDPVAFAAATLLLAAIALLAGYLPARRASRVDPLSALRFE